MGAARPGRDTPPVRHHQLVSAFSGRGGRRRFDGGGSWRAGPPDEPPPLLDPDRTRDPHRIFSLFVPYRARLASVIGLIVVSSGLSMISPFLLRSVLDDALPHR